MEQQNEGAVISVSGIDSDQLLVIAEQAEKRIEAIKKIKGFALRVTNHQDWVDQNGKPYMQVSGSEKIARLFGISWRIEEPVLDMLDDGHFNYTYKGFFSMGSSEIEAIGTRSSKDKFFSQSGGSAIPPSEIDRNDVKKGAYTNCCGNGITRLLGLRNLTWEDVQAAGIDKSKSGTVAYKSSDPSAAPNLPNYGDHKGKAITDPSISIDGLKYYLGGLDKNITNPEKADFKAKNEKLRDAIKAEIEKRGSALKESASNGSEWNQSSMVSALSTAPDLDSLNSLWTSLTQYIKNLDGPGRVACQTAFDRRATELKEPQ